MTENPKYDAYDIEQLMLEKSYYELEQAEREFVLEHVDTEQAYEDMRKTLLNIAADGDSEELLSPPPRIKEALMAEFAQEQNHRPIYLWLNAIPATLFPEGKSVHRQPGIQAALAAMLVVAFLFFGPDFGSDPTVGNDIVASNETPTSKPDVLQTKADSVANPMKSNLLEADADENNYLTAEAQELEPTGDANAQSFYSAVDDAEATETEDFIALAEESAEEINAPGLASFDDELADETTTIATEQSAAFKDGTATSPNDRKEDAFGFFGTNVSDYRALADEESDLAEYKETELERETLAAAEVDKLTQNNRDVVTGNTESRADLDNNSNATTISSADYNNALADQQHFAEDELALDGTKIKEAKDFEQRYDSTAIEQPSALAEIAFQGVENTAQTNEENSRFRAARSKNKQNVNDAVSPSPTVTGGALPNIEQDNPNSRSLANDEELIGILFTAL